MFRTQPLKNSLLIGEGEDRGMRYFFVMAMVGFVSQLIDGSLGMAYGVTTSTLLLGMGIAPAIASASIHIAELGTTAASGISHWKFGNVSWRELIWLGLPGGVAAFFGAIALTSISGESARPWVSIILAGL